MNYPTRIRNDRGLTLIERTIAACTVAVMIATLALTVMAPASASERAVLTLDGAASPPDAVISYAQHDPSDR